MLPASWPKAELVRRTITCLFVVSMTRLMRPRFEDRAWEFRPHGRFLVFTKRLNLFKPVGGFEPPTVGLEL
jgi:hypothetical protein